MLRPSPALQLAHLASQNDDQQTRLRRPDVSLGSTPVTGDMAVIRPYAQHRAKHIENLIVRHPILACILLMFMTMIMPVNVVKAEYLYKLTKDQCEARGGRITQWTNTAGTYPEVGTCLIELRNRSENSSRPRPSERGRETDEDDIPDVKLTRAEGLSLAQKLEQKAREFFSQKDWNRVHYPAGAAMRQYDELADRAASQRMDRLDKAAYCKYWQEQAQIKKTEGRFEWAKNLYLKALNEYCRPSDTDVSTVTAEIEALSSTRPLDRSVDREQAEQARTSDHTAIPDPNFGRSTSASGQAQAPGVAANCISVREEQAYRSFTLNNQCTFTVSFRVQTTDFNKSREWQSLSLAGGSTISLVSYYEEPTIADPKSPIEAARDEYAFLVQMKAKIDDMPNGSQKEAAKAQFVNLLASFTKKVSGSAR